MITNILDKQLMRIALVSLNQYWERKDLNFESCLPLLKRAKWNNVDLVIFPEMTLTSFSMNINITAEDRNSSQTLNLFKKLATDYQIAVIFGVVFRDGNKALNNAILIDKNGEIISNYSKIHPFSPVGENEIFNSGKEISVSQFNNSYVGLTVCYDLRFPEIFSALSKDCDLVVNIANWPFKRIDHWNVLLKARAIENQLFVIGVNRIGSDPNGLEYRKSSQIITPNGELLVPILSEGEMDIYDVDLKYIDEIRKAFPFINDRKPAFYKSIL
jgi:predicted amidohydrolase